MGGMPRLAVTASGGTEKCHTAEKPVKVRGKGEEGVFSSFPTLTGKGWRNLLTTAFLQVGFFISHLDQEQKSAYRQKQSLSALAWCGRWI